MCSFLVRGNYAVLCHSFHERIFAFFKRDTIVHRYGNAFPKEPEPPPPPEEPKAKLTTRIPKTERYIRKILGASILILTLLFVLVVSGVGIGLLIGYPLLLIPPVISLVLGVYLLREENYRLKIDILLAVLGLIVYLMPYPVYPSSTGYLMLKPVAVTADLMSEAADPLTQVALVMIVVNITVFGSAIFLLISDILWRSKSVIESRRRTLVSLAILLMTFSLVFGLPWFYPIRVTSGSVAGISGPGPRATYDLDRTPGRIGVSFNAETHIWTYRISIIGIARDENTEITQIIGRGPLAVNVGITVAIGSRKIVFPPFGEDVDVVGGEKTEEKIVVRPGTTATLVIYSKYALFQITLMDAIGQCCYIAFWQPG